MTAPALSIVVTGRHDNYGGDFNERFLTSLRFNHARLAEHDVAYELVLVEWNPVPASPYLADVISRHCAEAGAPTLRPYVVDPEYHAAFAQNPQLGYLEYVAKNVGIRRAAGRFILITNTDVLLGRHVVETIAAGRLANGTIYRAARYDVKLGADQNRLSWEGLEAPQNHVMRPALEPPLFRGGTGDFVLEIGRAHV